MTNVLEIELTFLARRLPTEVKGQTGAVLTDVYVPKDIAVHPHIRLRQKDDAYEITKKVPVTDGDASVQQEMTIPLTKEEFLSLSASSTRRVSKLRYNISIDGYAAEVDVFQDELAGLILMDFEFDGEASKAGFVMPEVCLADVTQEEFIAGGMLAGKKYDDIAPQLEAWGYQKIIS
jgi:CYTH domain-containing protein